MHAQIWTLFRVANQQSGRNQVVAKKVAISVYVIGWKLLSFSPFPRAYKAKLTAHPDDTNDAI